METPPEAAGPADPLFWGPPADSLVPAFAVTVPVRRWMIGRGRGHAVVHAFRRPRAAAPGGPGTPGCPAPRGVSGESAYRKSWDRPGTVLADGPADGARASVRPLPPVDQRPILVGTR